jgi:hypothetical protein
MIPLEEGNFLPEGAPAQHKSYPHFCGKEECAFSGLWMQVYFYAIPI